MLRYTHNLYLKQCLKNLLYFCWMGKGKHDGKSIKSRNLSEKNNRITYTFVQYFIFYNLNFLLCFNLVLEDNLSYATQNNVLCREIKNINSKITKPR
jgi:hypothetical protein